MVRGWTLGVVVPWRGTVRERVDAFLSPLADLTLEALLAVPLPLLSAAVLILGALSSVSQLH